MAEGFHLTNVKKIHASDDSLWSDLPRFAEKSTKLADRKLAAERGEADFINIARADVSHREHSRQKQKKAW